MISGFPDRPNRGKTPSVNAPFLTGVVLAGGRSRRMRRNKATLLAGSEPLWRRQRRVLRASGCTCVLIALRPRQRSLGDRAQEIRDRVNEAGPLAGIEAALAASASPLLAVLAVDMPRITASWFRRLLRLARKGRGAVFRGAGGLEPLAAVYPQESLPIVRQRLRRRQLAVQQLVSALVRASRMKVVPLLPALRPQAANWNRPADRRQAGRR